MLHSVCPRDDAVNRISRARLEDHPNCDHCHHPLFKGEPVELTAERFEVHLTRNTSPLLVDFWAPWCGPCLSMAPAYRRAARALEPRLRLAMVDTECEPGLAQRFAIRSIPTMILFWGGREVARRSGWMTTTGIVAWVDAQLRLAASGSRHRDPIATSQWSTAKHLVGLCATTCDR